MKEKVVVLSCPNLLKVRRQRFLWEDLAKLFRRLLSRGIKQSG
jgi:hypothetical protein